MKLNRLLSYFFGYIVLLVPAFVYVLHLHFLGFPDGHLTELERAEIILYKISIGPMIILGIYFCYLGFIANKQSIKKKLMISIFIYIILISVIIIIDFYLRLHFDHGIGG